MTWNFNEKPIDEADVPEKAIGFIYLITNNVTGKLYLGRKLLTKAGTKVVAGTKKKIRKDSDWKEYWSSSPDLQLQIVEHGKENFKREILMFATTKSSLNYMEEMALHIVGALESDKWANGNIRAKVFRRNLQKTLTEISEFRVLLKKYL